MFQKRQTQRLVEERAAKRRCVVTSQSTEKVKDSIFAVSVTDSVLDFESGLTIADADRKQLETPIAQYCHFYEVRF